MAEPKTKQQPKAQPKPKVRVVPPVTEMVHLFTGQRITHEPIEVEAIDGWLSAQIDAGKLVEC